MHQVPQFQLAHGIPCLQRTLGHKLLRTWGWLFLWLGTSVWSWQRNRLVSSLAWRCSFIPVVLRWYKISKWRIWFTDWGWSGHPVLATVNSLYCGHPRDRELVSLIARVRNSGNLFQSVIYFCRGFSYCPYYRDARKVRVDCSTVIKTSFQQPNFWFSGQNPIRSISRH